MGVRLIADFDLDPDAFRKDPVHTPSREINPPWYQPAQALDKE
jgi:hypothetical protein